MPIPNKPKPCNCGSKNLSPQERLQQTIDTRSSVCFQSFDDLQRVTLRGIFPGAVRGVNIRKNSILNTGWITPE